jgi:hypothetical protein
MSETAAEVPDTKTNDAERPSEAKRLIRHAVGVFGFSTWVVGIAQTLAATIGFLRPGSEAQFRTAHVGGTVHAALMFGMAGALRELTLSDPDRRSLVDAMIMMGWGNSVGYALGAFIGKRGLEPWASAYNVLTRRPTNQRPTFRPMLDKNLPPFLLFVLAIVGLARVLQLTYRGSRESISPKALLAPNSTTHGKRA